MRSLALGVALVALSGCAGKIRPKGPVLDGWQRIQDFDDHKRSGARYSGQPVVAHPIVPLMAFGAAYELDLAVRSKHPDWDMHEFVRMETAKGPVWVVVETREGSGEQFVVGDLEAIDLFMPELPLQRKATPIQVDDRSTEEVIDVTITYENVDGQLVEFDFQGDPPRKVERKRNGNTMGHSRNALLAVVDIPHRENAFKANLKIDGKGYAMQKVAGIVPFQFALVQTQGGLAVADFVSVEQDTVPWDVPRGVALYTPPEPAQEPQQGLQRPEEAEEELPPGTRTRPEEGVEEEELPPGTRTRPEEAEEVPEEEELVEEDEELPEEELVEEDDEPEVSAPAAAQPPLADFISVHRMASGQHVAMDWDVVRAGDRVHAIQRSPERTLDYSYKLNGDALELADITVQQYGRGVPATAIEISPPLPDLRRPFQGRHSSRFVIDVNGQRNYATGTIETWWTEAGPKVRVLPEAPDWTEERPLSGSIQLGERRAMIQVDRAE